MYISKITLHNFKGFQGDHSLNFDSGINFFVGDNNCGKSTIFEAIDFICSKRIKEEIITKIDDVDFVSVEIELQGDDLEALLETETLKKYKSYLIDTDSKKSLRILRSSKTETIEQNKKSIELNIDKVRIYNPETTQFENPTGIDKTISALFETIFVSADLDIDKTLDLAKTNTCGKLVAIIAEKFKETDTWKEYETTHQNVFNTGEKSLRSKLQELETKIENNLSSQFGKVEKVKFDFRPPKIEDLFKSGGILLTEENGKETTSSEKGTGMQRALALSLIQVYADISSTAGEEEISKPLMFFIDEPETFLHPQAQNKLLDALEKISKKSQVFIITHSPYLLKKYKKDTHSLNVFSKDKETGFNQKPKSDIELDLFKSSSPTWGEINYWAFDLITEDFHNELYGFIQAKAVCESIDNEKEEDFDKYLVSKGIAKSKKWIAVRQGTTQPAKDRTLPTYIRNFIHHPENDKNAKYTEDELKNSITSLIKLLETI